MSKVIKRTETGDISPETGFADTPAKRAPIIDRGTFEAKSDAQQIREKALAEAMQIKEEAMAEAEQIRQACLTECEQLREKARATGYTEGRDTGAAELSEIVASTSQRLSQVETQAVPQLRDLAVSIARKVIGSELEIRPLAVVDIVKQALSEKARARRELFLRVHPDDLTLLREHKPELLEVLSRAKEIGIREDPDVAPHGVIIETDAGIIDAQLDTQLAVFERILRETR